MNTSFPTVFHTPRRLTFLLLATACLVAFISLAGSLFPQAIYPSDQLRRTFITNDAVNLCNVAH